MRGVLYFGIRGAPFCNFPRLSERKGGDFLIPKGGQVPLPKTAARRMPVALEGTGTRKAARLAGWMTVYVEGVRYRCRKSLPGACLLSLRGTGTGKVARLAGWRPVYVEGVRYRC